MTVLHVGDGRSFLGGSAWVKVESGTADFSAFETHIPPSTPAVPLHVHDRYDEAFYVIEGEMQFVVGDLTATAETGAFVFVKRGEPHQFWNSSAATARMLAIGSSEIQALVEELAVLLLADPPDGAAIGEAFARHHSRIVQM